METFILTAADTSIGSWERMAEKSTGEIDQEEYRGDDHVRIGGAYFDVLDTEYTLREVSAGTELRARMSYRVSTSFNWYARPIAAFLIGNFEEAALSFYAHRATAQSPSL